MSSISCPPIFPSRFCRFSSSCPPPRPSNILAVPSFAHFIARMPWLLQLFLAIVVADLAEWIRFIWALHKVPFLWRFHSIHHSSKALDWIAGSRSHLLDDTLVRGFILVPLMLGFSQSIILAYLIFVTLHATWTHCNFRPNVKWLEPFIVMPRYHHWHHSSQKEAIDKNFAIHFPWIDRLFGTHYYPEEWPARYGLDGEGNRPWLYQADLRAVYQEERAHLRNPTRPGRRPEGFFTPSGGAFHEPERFHESDGQVSEIVFGFVVAQPQEDPDSDDDYSADKR